MQSEQGFPCSQGLGGPNFWEGSSFGVSSLGFRAYDLVGLERPPLSPPPQKKKKNNKTTKQEKTTKQQNKKRVPDLGLELVFGVSGLTDHI